MALGEVEVRLNAARYKSGLAAHALKENMMSALDIAKSQERVTEILAAAKEEAAVQKIQNEEMPNDVIADAEAMAAELPELAERLQEAMDYRDVILAEANNVLADASAGADLMAAISGAHVRLDGLIEMLQKRGAQCEEN